MSELIWIIPVAAVLAAAGVIGLLEQRQSPVAEHPVVIGGALLVLPVCVVLMTTAGGGQVGAAKFGLQAPLVGVLVLPLALAGYLAARLWAALRRREIDPGSRVS